MLSQFMKISNEQWFIIMAFILSLILSFLLGYTVFRYLQVESCKESMQVMDFADSIYK